MNNFIEKCKTKEVTDCLNEKCSLNPELCHDNYEAV